MKKLFAISLLSMYLISTTELYQLVKLPILVEHFIEHKQENKDLTLWKYLCMHYDDSDIKDNDHEKDMKLPFKSHEGCPDSNIIPFIPNHFSTEIFKPFSNETKSFPSYDEAFLTSCFLSNIWQPPKSC